MPTVEPVRRPVHRRAAALFAAALAALVLAPGAAAHVNRTMGPYTMLVVLVEEPYFEDNHAGFEFWVRRGDIAIDGLESTVHARATGHGVTVELTVSPPDEAGFYVLDTTTTGEPFDPRGGGAWSLILTGTVHELRISEVIPVTFPSYPRVATAPAAAAPAPATDPVDGVAAWLVVGAVMALGLGGGLWSRRRERPLGQVGAAPPV
jgi:hypothetical protein